MSGAVLEPVVAGEQHERGRVRRLDNDVGDHHLELFDAPRGRVGLRHAIFATVDSRSATADRKNSANSTKTSAAPAAGTSQIRFQSWPVPTTNLSTTRPDAQDPMNMPTP